MAISFVAAGVEGSGSAGTTIDPGLPAGIQANDILICAAACWDGNSVGSMGADWTRIVENSNGTSFCSMAVFWHRYDGSTTPSTTVTFSVSSADGKVGGICAFRGCKTSASPFNQQSTDGTGSDNTIEHNTITTTVNNCFLLCIDGTDANDARTSIATGFTNIFEDTTAGTDLTFRQTEASIHASYLDQGSQGATGSLVVNGSALGGWTSVLLALEPASTNKILTAGSGSYNITGTTASLERSRLFAAESGSYSINGTSATLRLGKRIATDAGSYMLTGSAAAFARIYRLTADAGSYNVNGADASLELGRKLIAEIGSYAINGQSAAFVRTYKLIAEAGSYVLTGSDATLTKSGTKLIAESGAYALTGSNIGLLKTHILTAGTNAYTITGYDATLTIAVPSPHKGKRRIRGRVVRIHGYNAARGKVV